MSITGKKERLSRKAEDSDLLDHAVRVGLVSYGIQHLLIAWLAMNLVFGDRSGQASNSGALHQLAGSGLGQTSLYVVAAGFVALIVWQGIEAAIGHHDEDGAKRHWKRFVSAVKVGIYATLGVSALKVATGSSSKGSSTDTWTARLMSAPGGVILVALVGAIVVGVGVALMWRGWTEKFASKLDSKGKSGKDGSAYLLFGKAGYLAKGFALGLIGALFLYAALTHDPDKSAGLDRALSQLLEQPFGGPMVAAVAVGIAGYGLFCFAWARHLDR